VSIKESIDTKRLVLGIEYDGSSYYGWQRQPHAASVQESLEKSLSEVANEKIEITCAGRTDTGVHATSQVVHFDCQNPRPIKAWLKGANSLLPQNISIRYAQAISKDFHARFSALSRSYLYVIDNNSVKPAIMSQGLTWIRAKLDVDKMNSATEHFIGEHDFTSLRSSRCQSNSANRNISKLRCKRYGEYIVLEVTANAFLHHMVRNIVGTLIEIGDGRRNSNWAREVIAAKNRCIAGVTSAPNGLYLVGVMYPEEFNLPRKVRAPVFLEHLINNRN
jgi:tRNA pseudouridine38-40 synthase